MEDTKLFVVTYILVYLISFHWIKMSLKTHQTLPLFHVIGLCLYRTQIEGIATEDTTHPSLMQNFLCMLKNQICDSKNTKMLNKSSWLLFGVSFLLGCDILPSPSPHLFLASLPHNVPICPLAVSTLLALYHWTSLSAQLDHLP